MVGVLQGLHLLLSKEGSFGCGKSKKTVQLMSILIYSPHGKNQEKHTAQKKESKSSN